MPLGFKHLMCTAKAKISTLNSCKFNTYPSVPIIPLRAEETTVTNRLVSVKVIK